jgi:cytosine/adenosine deaminase-related metal-dependent hydrolase
VLKTEALAENVEFAKHSCDENINAMMGVHASFTVEDYTLETIREINKELNLGIHVHLCEDAVDNEISNSKYGAGALARLVNYNLINDKSILAHGIHLNEDDYNTIQNFKSSLAFNPHSNLNNAVGLPQYAALPSDLSILCGTDGMHANVVSSFKQIFLQLRHQKTSFDNAFPIMEKIYFDQINFVRKYYPDYPGLNAGDRADLIIWDYVPPTPFTPENFFGHYIYGITERQVCTAISEGNMLLKDYKLSWDEEQIWSEVSKQGARLTEEYKKLI